MSAEVPSYSLIDNPWISVLDQHGRARLVSLRELFDQAHELRALAGDLPTQTFAILRLVLAILHRAVDGPANEREWVSLWQSTALPMGDIDGYLSAFAGRFDLYHPTAPFYQVADLRTDRGDTSGLERLIADVPNGLPYLTSRAGPGLARISAAEAARWVVHCQAFDPSGIKSGAVGDSRVKGGKGYPIGTGWCGSLGGVFVEGRTLRETLLLNLIPLDSAHVRHDRRDVPVWERPPHGPGEEPQADRGPHGRLSLYTWQSRRLRLVGDQHAVTGVLVTNGDQLAADNLHDVEPFTAWRRSAAKEKLLKQPTIYVPSTHDPARALWRGLRSLLPDTSAATTATGSPRQAPPIAQWLARVRNAGHVEPGFRVTTRAIGLTYGTQYSVVDEVYHDALTMNLHAFEPGGLRTAIVDSAADAEAAVIALKDLAANLCRAAGGSGADRRDPPAAAAARAAELGFAELDQRFRRWLAALGHDTDPGQARTAWQQVARETVARLGAELATQAGPSAWAGRYVSNKDRWISTGQAEVWFRRDLARALPLAASAIGDAINHPEEVPA